MSDGRPDTATTTSASVMPIPWYKRKPEDCREEFFDALAFRRGVDFGDAPCPTVRGELRGACRGSNRPRQRPLAAEAVRGP